jgi:hypothetical protein
MADITQFKPYMLPVDDILKAEKERQELYTTATPKKWEAQEGEMAQLVVPVKVFRDFGNGMVDIHTDNGCCLVISKKALHKPFFELINKDYNMKAMKDAVLTVAKQLAKANNTVTTLEIKTELRRDYPYYFWTQSVVSSYMDQLAGDGIFSYTDNGTYRTYSLVTPKKIIAKPMPAKVILKSRSTQVGISRNRKGISKPISQVDALQLAHNTGFESVVINRKKGKVTYTKADIRAQKKSPFGFIDKSYGSIAQITVAGTTYLVK